MAPEDWRTALKGCSSPPGNRRKKILERSRVNLPNPSPCPRQAGSRQFIPVSRAFFPARVVKVVRAMRLIESSIIAYCKFLYFSIALW